MFDYGSLPRRWLLIKIASGERKEQSAFHRIPAVIKHQGEQILPTFARRKDTTDVIEPRLNLGRDKNSMNAIQAATGIVARMHQ